MPRLYWERMCPFTNLHACSRALASEENCERFTPVLEGFMAGTYLEVSGLTVQALQRRSELRIAGAVVFEKDPQDPEGLETRMLREPGVLLDSMLDETEDLIRKLHPRSRGTTDRWLRSKAPEVVHGAFFVCLTRASKPASFLLHHRDITVREAVNVLGTAMMSFSGRKDQALMETVPNRGPMLRGVSQTIH